MLHVMLFFLLLCGCCGYALIAGGLAERVTAGMMMAAALLTSLVHRASTAPNFRTVDIGVMAVDVAFLLGLLVLLLLSRRYWPVWLAALQLVQVFVHVVRLVDTRLVPPGYVFALALWSYPMLLILAVATFRHRRRGAGEVDPPVRSGPPARKAPRFRGFQRPAIKSASNH